MTFISDEQLKRVCRYEPWRDVVPPPLLFGMAMQDLARELIAAREALRGVLGELRGYAHGDEPAPAQGVWSRDGEYLGLVASKPSNGEVAVIDGHTLTVRKVSDLYGAPYIEAARACLPEFNP